MNVSALTSGSNTVTPTDTKIFSTAMSYDGKYKVYSKKVLSNSLEIYRSNDYGATFTKATGIPQTLNGTDMNNSNIQVSWDGRVVAVAIYDTGSQNGGVYVSNDFGLNFTATSLSGLYAAQLAGSSDLSRIFSDDTLAGNKIYMVNSE